MPWFFMEQNIVKVLLQLREWYLAGRHKQYRGLCEATMTDKEDAALRTQDAKAVLVAKHRY